MKHTILSRVRSCHKRVDKPSVYRRFVVGFLGVPLRAAGPLLLFAASFLGAVFFLGLGDFFLAPAFFPPALPPFFLPRFEPLAFIGFPNRWSHSSTVMRSWRIHANIDGYAHCDRQCLACVPQWQNTHPFQLLRRSRLQNAVVELQLLKLGLEYIAKFTKLFYLIHVKPFQCEAKQNVPSS